MRNKRSTLAFFQGWADSVDFRGKTVTIEEGVDDPNQGLALAGDRHEGESQAERTKEKAEEAKKGQLFDLKYDKLVISVGCYSQTFGTPGVREHALFLKDVGDARKIRNRLLACKLVSFNIPGYLKVVNIVPRFRDGCATNHVGGDAEEPPQLCHHRRRTHRH